MMISRQEIYHVLKSQTRVPQATEADKREVDSMNMRDKRTDGVDLSERAQELSRAIEVIAQLPDIRPERVIPVAKAIENGTYDVHEDEVAEKIIGRSIVDHVD